jgi:hypothetical protein
MERKLGRVITNQSLNDRETNFCMIGGNCGCIDHGFALLNWQAG